MTFGLPPVRLVVDFRASAMGIKPKSPGSVATVSEDIGILASPPSHVVGQSAPPMATPEADLLRKTTWSRDESARLSEILQGYSARDAHRLLNHATLRPDEPGS